MPCQESEEEEDAPPLPGFTTPTKANRNDGAGHPDPDAEGLETESDADAEQQFDESTGKKRKYSPFHEYREVGRCATGEDSELEPAEITNEIKRLMINSCKTAA